MKWLNNLALRWARRVVLLAEECAIRDVVAVMSKDDVTRRESRKRRAIKEHRENWLKHVAMHEIPVTAIFEPLAYHSIPSLIEEFEAIAKQGGIYREGAKRRVAELRELSKVTNLIGTCDGGTN